MRQAVLSVTLFLLLASNALAGPVISAPTPGASVSGTVNVTCTESVAAGSWVNISIDGTQVLSSSTQTGTYSWNTVGLKGTHSVGCAGYYWSGGAVSDGSVSESVTVGSVVSHGWLNAFKVGYSGCCISAPVTLGPGATARHDMDMPRTIDMNLAITSTAEWMICNPNSTDTSISVTIGTDCSDDPAGAYPLLPYLGVSHPIYSSVPIKSGTCLPMTLERIDAAVTTNGGAPVPPISMGSPVGACPTPYPVPEATLTNLGSVGVTYQLDATQVGVPLTEQLGSSGPWY